MNRFWQHFGARAICLIAIPITLYLSFFVIHFNILKYSGPGDGFMSPRFQRSLQGSEIVKLSVGKLLVFFFFFFFFFFLLFFFFFFFFFFFLLYILLIIFYFFY